MSSVVCTLFEGHFHHGVAALANSLYNYGYRGVIYAGYRGPLPTWAGNAIDCSTSQWPGASILKVTDDFQILFLPINNEYHLTNYKPNFMLGLWESFANDSNAIAYFDPDIVIKCKWDFFETWMGHGVALVHESISNDMPPTHPFRKEWEKVIKKANRQITRQMHSYINGGFCGVSKENKEFLKDWIEITNAGIKYFKLTPGQWKHSFDRTYIFYAQDQDALNITAMCSNSPVSEIGPEGMDFIAGGFTMSHALGAPKPWKKQYIRSVLMGNAPSTPDKNFWKNTLGPIKTFGNNRIKYKKLTITLASFIARFYRRA
ncbi:hypothetical protein ACO2Q8_07495 [Larkinella sp. VNQ87]|uniref:hypothetical protein n=1 Tax=Larkinella sp. VNQ87 TaxID=3400921 RepID=UPI003C07C87E